MRLFRVNFFYFVLLTSSPSLFSQSLVDELETTTPTAQRGLNDNTFTEEIVVVSKSKRIFILTNKNQSLEPGDFVTMLVGDRKIVRGLIAKSREGKSAFKVLKSYNDRAKSRLKRGMSVQLFRGDESLLTENEETKPELRINNEADLFSDNVLFEEEAPKKKTSSIKNNNLIQSSIGLIQGIDNNGDAAFYNHFALSWSYRLKEFVWFESIFGYSTAKRFPSPDISTDLFNLTVRAKYTYELPFFSYLQPYAGLQIVIANSPEAGSGPLVSAAQANRELDLVDDIGKIAPALGVTYLKRLVPSWFVTVNMGLDLISVGLAIEY